MYKEMHKILPDGIESGRFIIKHNRVTRETISRDLWYAMRSGNTWLVQGMKADYPYCVLIERGIIKKTDKEHFSNADVRVWMSDTPMEQNTNRYFIQQAHGKILIAGLGIGMCVHALLDKPEVTEIVVLEYEQDIINLIAPYCKHPKVKIIFADAKEWFKSCKEKFNCVWLDIWSDISGDNYEEIKSLEKVYRKLLVSKKEDSNRFISSWVKDHSRKRYLEDKRFSSYYDALGGGVNKLMKALDDEPVDCMKKSDYKIPATIGKSRPAYG